MTDQFSYPKEKIKIVLLENIHQVAVEKLKSAGYGVTEIPKSLAEDDLLEIIKDAHVLGIRSKTKITEKHIAAAKRMLAIGCFGIGTNQVALQAATSAGIPVFNAPYSSTRSVAELAIAFVFALARRIGTCNNRMHLGLWEKSAKGSFEIRHKTIGIVGYGHIGQQVGLMAEALGMRVLFFDTTKKLPLGNAKPIEDLNDLLAQADYVSLHVPGLPGNRALIGEKELQLMKVGACLMNLSRGSIVDLAALRKAIENKHLGGAAIDVYPVEPKTNKEEFKCDLMGVDNVILTPHIGGSTEEAQENIGLEVAVSFIKLIDRGTTSGAVNFPSFDLPEFPESHRILNVHKNVPGVLNDVTRIIAGLGANINAQYLSTYKDVGYLIVDINKNVSDQAKIAIEALPSNIKTRILY